MFLVTKCISLVLDSVQQPGSSSKDNESAFELDALLFNWSGLFTLYRWARFLRINGILTNHKIYTSMLVKPFPEWQTTLFRMIRRVIRRAFRINSDWILLQCTSIHVVGVE